MNNNDLQRMTRGLERYGVPVGRPLQIRSKNLYLHITAQTSWSLRLQARYSPPTFTFEALGHKLTYPVSYSLYEDPNDPNRPAPFPGQIRRVSLEEIFTFIRTKLEAGGLIDWMAWNDTIQTELCPVIPEPGTDQYPF